MAVSVAEVSIVFYLVNQQASSSSNFNAGSNTGFQSQPQPQQTTITNTINNNVDLNSLLSRVRFVQPGDSDYDENFVDDDFNTNVNVNTNRRSIRRSTSNRGGFDNINLFVINNSNRPSRSTRTSSSSSNALINAIANRQGYLVVNGRRFSIPTFIDAVNRSNIYISDSDGDDNGGLNSESIYRILRGKRTAFMNGLPDS